MYNFNFIHFYIYIYILLFWCPSGILLSISSEKWSTIKKSIHGYIERELSMEINGMKGLPSEKEG